MLSDFSKFRIYPYIYTINTELYFGIKVAKQPYCLQFWMSAYGPRIGSLSISVIPANCDNCSSSVIWKLRPDKFLGLPDLWILSQAILVSPVDFRVIISRLYCHKSLLVAIRKKFW